jgi:hypothetical protein
MSRLETNEDLTIMIRQARLEDIENIWNLLHANCRTWTAQQINVNLAKMYVLVKNYKILGVLCGSFNLGGTEIEWIEIHPFYPEHALREVMVQGLLGTQTIDDVGKLPKKAICEQFSPIWDLK